MVLPFLTLYLTQRQGFTVQGAGGILSLYGIGAIVGAYVGGWCSDRIGAVRTQVVSLCLATCALVTLSQMISPLSVVVVVLLWSIAAESMRPANGAALAEMSPPHLHARVFGLRRLSMNLGMSIGPAVGGFLVAWSYSVLFLIEASMTLLAAGLLWGAFAVRWTSRTLDTTRPRSRPRASFFPPLPLAGRRLFGGCWVDNTLSDHALPVVWRVFTDADRGAPLSGLRHRPCLHRQHFGDCRLPDAHSPRGRAV